MPELAQRAAALLHQLGWAAPGDFLYDALAKWMRGQQLNRAVASCSLLALGVNLAVNIGLAGGSDPTLGPVAALVAQNTVLPLLLGARRLVGACLRAAALAQPLAAMSAPGR